MDFFDKLGKKASEAYKITAEKTSKLTKEAKLKLKNNENKAAIDELYIEIGKKVYEKHVRNEKIDIKKELEKECTQIDVLAAEIETNLNECYELKNKIKCNNCSTLVEKTAKFCPECGEKIEIVEIVEDEKEEEKAKKAKKTKNVEEKPKKIKKVETKTETKKEKPKTKKED